MAASGLAQNSHSGKALRHILETLPRDELFQSSDEELLRTCMGILGLQERARSKLFLRRDRYGRFFSVLVYIPRDRFNTEVRQRIEAMLMRALKGERIDTTVQIGESPLAQLHMIVRPKTRRDASTSIRRRWKPKLVADRPQLAGRAARPAWCESHGEERGHQAGQPLSASAMPAGYIESVTPELAASDVGQAGRACRRGRPAPVAVPQRRRRPALQAVPDRQGNRRCRTRCRCWRTSACASTASIRTSSTSTMAA